MARRPTEITYPRQNRGYVIENPSKQPDDTHWHVLYI